MMAQLDLIVAWLDCLVRLIELSSSLNRIYKDLISSVWARLGLTASEISSKVT